MAKFKVQAKVVTFCYVVVEAETAEEANGKAENIEGGDFITEPEPNGYFELIHAATEETDEEVS